MRGKSTRLGAEISAPNQGSRAHQASPTDQSKVTVRPILAPGSRRSSARPTSDGFIRTATPQKAPTKANHTTKTVPITIPASPVPVIMLPHQESKASAPKADTAQSDERTESKNTRNKLDQLTVWVRKHRTQVAIAGLAVVLVVIGIIALRPHHSANLPYTTASPSAKDNTSKDASDSEDNDDTDDTKTTSDSERNPNITNSSQNTTLPNADSSDTETDSGSSFNTGNSNPTKPDKPDNSDTNRDPEASDPTPETPTPPSGGDEADVPDDTDPPANTTPGGDDTTSNESVIDD